MTTSEVMYAQSESVSFERTASGKYTYKFKLLGSPEERVERVKKLKKEYDDVIDGLE